MPAFLPTFASFATDGGFTPSADPNRHNATWGGVFGVEGDGAGCVPHAGVISFGTRQLLPGAMLSSNTSVVRPICS